MNKNIFAFAFGGLPMLVLLIGCESARLRPAEVYSYPELRPMVTEQRLSETEVITRADTVPPAPAEGQGWRSLFDGTLKGWRVTEFGEGGQVEIQRGLLVFRMGEPFVGVNYTNEIPTTNYEVTLEALRAAGSDFFCGLTFPVRDSFCSLIVGGWGGSVVGLSNLDGSDASENETTQFINFETGRWYRIRLRVSEKKIEAWIEQKKVVDVVTTGRKISLRFGDIEMSKPFGLASWTTSAAFREIKIRAVTGPADPEK